MTIPIHPTILKSPSSKINTCEVLDAAIKNKDIVAAQDLLKKRDKLLVLLYSFWTRLIVYEVQGLDERLRDDFRKVLIELAGDKLHTFLRTALQNADEEPAALLILKQHPELFLKQLEGDIPFQLAAANREVEVVELFLQYAKKHDRWDLVFPRTGVRGDTAGSDLDGPQQISVLERAAEKGYSNVVEKLVDHAPKLLDYGYPLHKAVREGHLDVVKYLLDKRPELAEKLTPGPNPRSALFEVRSDRQDDDVSKRIQNLLISKIMRGGKQAKSPTMIRKLLKGSQDQYTEICLDLSVFSQTTHKFKPFVDGLVREQQLFEVRFYPILLYVQFPFLDASYHPGGPKAVGQGAERILQWLREKKGVTEIIELHVPGSTPRAESEEVIEKALYGISVDLLDWQVLDLSVEIILKSGAKNVEELHLYSSGNWGVLQQWSSIEGVTLLPNLKHLEITLIKGMISAECEQAYITRLQERLEDSHLANLRNRPPPSSPVVFNVRAGPWQSSESSRGSRMALGTLQETTETITKLKNFLNFYKTCDRANSRPTKVAIIDNGIDGTLSILSRTIVDGISFVEDYKGRESPWWLAYHPHGTQMASFIHQLDPCCGLYIAKVCDQSTSIDPDDVAQAITWAVGQDVDIISMSIAIPDGSTALRKAVEKAKANNVVMFGSRGDRGYNRGTVYPADYDEVISISSCTKFGKPTESAETDARYFLQGENVTIPAEPSYLESQKLASGSSVATALAAGVAALVLSCRRLGDKEPEMDRIRTIKTVFDRMTIDRDKSSKYVKPWEVFKDKRMDRREGLLWLKAWFGDKGDFAC